MLAEHCVSMAHFGYVSSSRQVHEMAKQMSETVDMGSMMHPKKGEKARDDAVKEHTLNAYFKELGNVLCKYDLKNKPQFTWNVDETGISFDQNPPKILARAGTNPHCVTSGKFATTTVIAAVSVLDETIPPFVIFKGKRLSRDIRSEEIEGTEYRSSQSG